MHVSGHFSSFFGPESGHEDHDEDEKIGALTHPFGRQQVPATQVVAGDLAAIARLSRAETGDTLSSPDDPRVLMPWSLPEPLLPVAIVARSKADEDKLSQALSRLAAEDPSIRVDNDAETHQLVLWCMGEAHADVVLERLAERYSVQVDTTTFLVSLRETFAGPAAAQGRHVKQSGGHGQYAVCSIEVEPLPEGGGFEFVDKVVGGAVPRQFIPSVEKGVRAQMERGVRHGYPVVDLRVTLTDGKAHTVDSSDMAFQMAGALALREAAATTRITMLEPYDTVDILIPDSHVGSVMSDLASRPGPRARFGTDKVGDDRTVVKAEVPQTELVRYATDLRASTQARRRHLHPHLCALRGDAGGRRRQGHPARVPLTRHLRPTNCRSGPAGRRTQRLAQGARVAQELLEDRPGGSRARVPLVDEDRDGEVALGRDHPGVGAQRPVVGGELRRAGLSRSPAGRARPRAGCPEPEVTTPRSIERSAEASRPVRGVTVRQAPRRTTCTRRGSTRSPSCTEAITGRHHHR